MEYSIPYLSILIYFGASAVFFEHTENRAKQQHIVLLSILVLYVFFAFRGYVYSDWTSYAELLRDVEWDDVFRITDPHQKAVVREPGFTLLCVLCKSITNEFAFLVIVITTIDTVLFFHFLKQWDIKNLPFVFMLFITFDGISIMFNLYRNQIAIFIFLNSLTYLIQRKPLPYFGLCLLALSFHLSSIVYFPLYFFLDKKINKWLFLGLSLGFIAFYFAKISVVMSFVKLFGADGALGEKAAFYTEALTSSRAFSLTGTIEKVGLTALIFLYYKELTELKNRHIIINCVLIYFFFYYVFAEFQDLSSRLAILFEFSYWIIWIDLVSVLLLRNNKKLLAGTLFLYCFYINLMAYNQPIQQYDNLLFGGMSQQERLRIMNRTFKPGN